MRPDAERRLWKFLNGASFVVGVAVASVVTAIVVWAAATSNMPQGGYLLIGMFGSATLLCILAFWWTQKKVERFRKIEQ